MPGPRWGAGSRSPGLPHTRLLGAFSADASQMRFLCDLVHQTVGLHHLFFFFPKSIYCLESVQDGGGWPGASASSGQDRAPSQLPRHPERAAPGPHCGVQCQGPPDRSHGGWVHPWGSPGNVGGTFLVAAPGGGGALASRGQWPGAVHTPQSGQPCPLGVWPRSQHPCPEQLSAPNPAVLAEI